MITTLQWMLRIWLTGRLSRNDIASIEAGLLETQAIDLPQDVTIYAEYTEGGNTVEAEKVVSIFAICPSGSALQFDGQNDYVETTTLSGIDWPITISVWIKAQELNFHQSIFGRNKGTSGGYYYENWLSIGGDNYDKVRFGDRLGGGGDPFVYSISPIEKDKWYHVAVTRASASGVRIYINGVLDNSGSTIDYDNSGKNYRIGTINTGHYPFNGKIDEVAVFNRALSAEEIRALMHTKLTGDEPNLVAYWDFDEGEGQVAGDLSPYDNDGRLGKDAGSR